LWFQQYNCFLNQFNLLLCRNLHHCPSLFDFVRKRSRKWGLDLLCLILGKKLNFSWQFSWVNRISVLVRELCMNNRFNSRNTITLQLSSIRYGSAVRFNLQLFFNPPNCIIVWLVRFIVQFWCIIISKSRA
jgi:hypothetical protein